MKIEIAYNDNLVARCILAGIDAFTFVADYTDYKNWQGDSEEVQKIHTDFARVKTMLDNKEI